MGTTISLYTTVSSPLTLNQNGVTVSASPYAYANVAASSLPPPVPPPLPPSGVCSPLPPSGAEHAASPNTAPTAIPAASNPAINLFTLSEHGKPPFFIPAPPRDASPPLRNIPIISYTPRLVNFAFRRPAAKICVLTRKWEKKKHRFMLQNIGKDTEIYGILRKTRVLEKRLNPTK